MKKILFLTLALIVCFTFSAFAEDTVATVVANGSCSDTVEWRVYSSGAIVILGEGNIEDMEMTEDYPWYKYKSQITAVLVEDGITNVPDNAFYAYSNLNTVKLGDTVESIGEGAFGYCRALEELTVSAMHIEKDAFASCTGITSLTINHGVEMIDEGAFSSCGFTEVTIPASVWHIGDEAFNSMYLKAINVNEKNKYYSSVDGVLFNEAGDLLIRYPNYSENKKYTIPDGVEYIYQGAFKDSVYLEEVVFSSSVISINEKAFHGSSALKNVTLSSSLYNIDKSAFAYCSSLENITIPASVQYIDSLAFDGCSKLKNIYVEEGNEIYLSIDGVLLSHMEEYSTISGYRLIKYPQGNTRTSYTLPKLTVEIGDYAFYGAKNLTEINFVGIYRIGERAFANCKALESVLIDSYTNYIGKYCFQNCTALKQVKIFANIDTIPVMTFSGCSRLEYLLIPSSVTSIGYNAFPDNDLFTIYAKKGSYAYTYACDNGISFVEYVPKADGIQVTPPDKREYYIGEGLDYNGFKVVAYFEDGTVANVTGEAVFGAEDPTYFEELGEVTFHVWYQNCSQTFKVTVVPKPVKLEKIEITKLPDKTEYDYGDEIDITGIEVTAYYSDGTTADVTDDVYIDEDKSYIYGITKQTVEVYYSPDDASLFAAKFQVKVNSDFIAMGERDGFVWTLDKNGNLTVEGYGWIYEVYWKEYISQIKNAVFSNGIERIPDLAFFGADNLESVILADSVKVIGTEAFKNCKSLSSVTLSEALEMIEYGAFENCTSLKKIELPRSVNMIYGAFIGCSSLEEITVDDENTFFTVVDGVVFTSDMMNLVIYPANKSGKTYEIPESVNSINAYAFAFSQNLESVTVSGNVEWIEDGAFAFCSALTEINVDRSNWMYTSVDGVLYTCDFTELVAYPAGKSDTSYCITNDEEWSVKILEYAFSGASNLVEVKFDADVYRIGKSAFAGCTSLEVMALPAGISSLDEYTFKDCTSLELVKIPAYCEYIEHTAFSGCTALKVLDVHPANYAYKFKDGVLFNWSLDCIKYYLPSNTATSYTMPDTVMFVSDYAFENATALEEIKFSKRLDSIGKRAFAGCTGLESLELPWRLYAISEEAFEGCTSLESVAINSEYVYLESRVFKGCTSLTDVYIESSDDFNVLAFDGCDAANFRVKRDSYAEMCVANYGLSYISEDRYSLNYIEVESLPAKTEYFIGDTLDITGLKVVADCVRYIDDTATGVCEKEFITIDVTDDIIISEGNIFFNKTGEYIVNFEYKNHSQSFTVNVEARGYDYGECGANAVWIVDLPGTLTIKGSGDIDYAGWKSYLAPLNTDGDDDDDDKTTDDKTTKGKESFAPVVTKVIIEEGITSIPYEAFSFSGIESVSLPETLKNIGSFAFCECRNLTEISIPENVCDIGDAAFLGCRMLESVTIPYGVEYIPSSVFLNCFSLKNIDIKSDLLSIGDNAFANCKSLESFIIPDTVKNIESCAFIGCSSLKSIVIPERVEYIPDLCFVECTSLASVTLGGVIREIGASAFESSGIEKIVIPEDIVFIGEGAFSNCKNLKSVEINSHNISELLACFVGCENLESITIPSCITWIDFNGFEGCNKLSSFVIGKNNAFYSSQNGIVTSKDGYELYMYLPGNTAKAYTVPSTVDVICENAFAGNTCLESIDLGFASVVEIGAFNGCSALTDVVIPWTTVDICDYSFENCKNLKTVTVEGSTFISSGAFAGCESLEKVTLSVYVADIMDDAFNGCENLTLYVAEGSSAEEFAEEMGIPYVSEARAELVEIVIETLPTKTEYTVGEYLDASGIKVVAVYDDGTEVDVTSRTRIEFNERFDCDGEVTIDVNYNDFYAELTVNVSNPYYAYSSAYDNVFWTLDYDGVLNIFGDGEILDCNWSWYNEEIKEITVADSISYICDYAFAELSELTRVTLPEGIEEIPCGLFSYSPKLCEVNIPDSVIGIAPKAFAGCEALEQIIIPASVEKFGDEVFYGCDNLTVHGYKGTAIEEYAEENDINFIAIDSESVHVLSHILVTKTGKVDYTEGDTLDTAGLVVMAYYTDGACEDITDKVSIDTKVLDTVGVITVTVTYKDKTAKYMVNVAEKVVEPEIIAEGEAGELFWVLNSDGVLTVFGEGEIPNYTRTATATWYAYAKQIKKIVVENGVTRLGDYCFYNLAKATSIEVADTVKAVGVQFIRQTAITEIALEGDVEITANAFGRADSLKTLILTEDAKTFFGNIFYSENVTIVAPENSFAHKYAEYYSTKFSSSKATVSFESDGTMASLPVVRFTSAGDNAFFAIYENKKGAWFLEVSGYGAMKNFPYVSQKNLEKGFTFSPMYYISEEKLESKVLSIEVRNGITTIGNYIFYKCTKAVQLILPDGITSIGQGAFRLCQRLTTITLPETVTKIEKNAFLSCGKLSEIYIPEGVTTVGEGIFEKCTLEGLTVKTKSKTAIEVISAEYPTVTIVSNY